MNLANFVAERKLFTVIIIMLKLITTKIILFLFIVNEEINIDKMKIYILFKINTVLHKNTNTIKFNNDNKHKQLTNIYLKFNTVIIF